MLKGYIFPVQPDIVAEIEKRKNRSNENPSVVGYGCVPATVTKTDSRTIMNTWTSCLNEIRPIDQAEEKVKKKKNDDDIDTLFDNFFSEDNNSINESKEVLLIDKPKRKFNLNDEITERKKIKKEVEYQFKNFKKQNIATSKPKIDSRIKVYYEKLQDLIEWGSIGELPPIYKKNNTLPKDLDTFVNSDIGQVLRHFCQK